ncbi:MAG: saccharopine dehydrogenase NADP-binding domain-containing protein [Ornithinimicrobium sp.]
MPSDREFDLVLVGATGFVGRLTAAHLARSAPSQMRIALAARNLDTLTSVQRDLPENAHAWPLLTVDVTDQVQADDLAARTAVIATTVGPYAAYGRQLVSACAHAGTHYADLTGEVLFVHDTVARLHNVAEASGARIVHSCGFDSIPSDLGVMLAAHAASDDDNGRLVDVTLHVRAIQGGFSGGTIDSMRQQMVAMREEPSTRRVVADPDALASERTAYGRGPGSIGKDPVTGRWHGPFVMSSYNTRIVRRSWSLTQGAAPLLYDEVVDTGRGATGAATAVAIGAGTTALVAAMAVKPTRLVLDRLLPAPGEGPSAQKREAGMFEIEVVATTTQGTVYEARVAAPYDPGYDGTAIMLGESAVALARDEGSTRAGVLTPATALGAALVERLRAHGFTLEVTRR